MPTFVIFILVLSVLVLVHEFGHFIVAKILKIKVEEFALGLPFTRALVSYHPKGSETKYSIYPVLFGGFVKLHGEEEAGSEKHRSFWHRRKTHRVSVLVAGVAMNLVLAMVCFVFLYSQVGVPVEYRDRVVLSEISADGPAKDAGFVAGDRVLEVEGVEINNSSQFVSLMKSWAGVGVNVKVERGEVRYMSEGVIYSDSETVDLYVVPREKPPEGQGALGVMVDQLPFVKSKMCNMLDIRCVWSAVEKGFVTTSVWVGRVLDGLSSIGKSLLAARAPEGVSGPVGIYQVTGVVASHGFLQLVELVAILSINLAVFNLLPIPALDGGRIAFIVVEVIIRRRIPTIWEQRINSWGMSALIILMIVVSFWDVWKLIFVRG